jgi:hypothetical protein
MFGDNKEFVNNSAIPQFALVRDTTPCFTIGSVRQLLQRLSN